jgi:hypothetical protein
LSTLKETELNRFAALHEVLGRVDAVQRDLTPPSRRYITLKLRASAEPMESMIALGQGRPF